MSVKVVNSKGGFILPLWSAHKERVSTISLNCTCLCLVDFFLAIITAVITHEGRAESTIVGVNSVSYNVFALGQTEMVLAEFFVVPYEFVLRTLRAL